MEVVEPPSPKQWLSQYIINPLQSALQTFGWFRGLNRLTWYITASCTLYSRGGRQLAVSDGRRPKSKHFLPLWLTSNGQWQWFLPPFQLVNGGGTKLEHDKFRTMACLNGPSSVHGSSAGTQPGWSLTPPLKCTDNSFLKTAQWAYSSQASEASQILCLPYLNSLLSA